jgi:hypothetical protein
VRREALSPVAWPGQQPAGRLVQQLAVVEVRLAELGLPVVEARLVGPVLLIALEQALPERPTGGAEADRLLQQGRRLAGRPRPFPSAPPVAWPLR